MDKRQPPPPYEECIPSQPILMPKPGPQEDVQVVQVVTVPNLGPVPQRYVCPFCHENITTHIRHQPSSRTHWFALLGCLLGGIFCVWLPYVIDSCQNANHYCPSCRAYLGAYEY